MSTPLPSVNSKETLIDDSAKQKYDQYKEDSGKRKEKIKARAHGAMHSAPATIPFAEELSVVSDGRTWHTLTNGETFIEGLNAIDPKLVTNAKRTHGVFTSYTVLPGEIGKVTKHGKTKFYPPGNYAYLGAGRKWFGVEQLQKEGVDTKVVHQDVTLLTLTENQVAVVQIEKKQQIIGSGRYIIRQPATLEGGPIDIQKLTTQHTAKVITEGSKTSKNEHTGVVTVKNVQYTKTISSGSTAEAGAITFIRAEPGFHYLIQTSEGYRIGKEFTVARGDEKFLGFMNFLQQSRTTKRFSFLSSDHHRVEMTVQLTWQMEDGIKWVTRGRAYDDPFDMLEEKAEAFFRDQIISIDHQKVMKQKSDGFDHMEKNVFPKLATQAANLGAKLMSMEVRELHFPLIEKRELQLAEKEAIMKEKELQAKRDLELQQIGSKSKASEEKATQDREEQAAKAKAGKSMIEDQRNLAKVEAENKQRLAKVEGETKEEMARLEAKKTEASIKAASDEIVAKGKANVKKAEAQAEAESILVLQDAKNQALLMKAKAEAQAAELMGKALNGNPGLLELKKAELAAQTEIERAKAIKAFAKNPNALLPNEITRDLLRMRHGERPQEFLPVLGAAASSLEKK